MLKPNSAVPLALVFVQVADVALHAATGQLEPLRVTSNIVIVLWLAAGARGLFRARPMVVALSAVGAYLALNLAFLAREGMTNAAQGGGLRIALFAFVLLTLALSAWLMAARRQHQPATKAAPPDPR